MLNTSLLSDENTSYIQYVSTFYSYIIWNPVKNLKLNIGARAEYSYLNSKFNDSELFLNRNYFNIIPEFSLSYKTAANQTLSVSYSENIKRPSLYYLSPFVNSVNGLFKHTGNPDLKPEIYHFIDMTYSIYFDGYYIRPELYRSFSNNSIQPIAVIDNSGGVTNTFQNGGKTVDNFVYLGLGGTLFKIMQFNLIGGFGNTSVKFNNLNSSNTFYTLSPNNTISFKKGIRVQFAGFFNSPTVTPQGRITGTNLFSVSTSKSWHEDKSSIIITVSNPFSKNRTITNKVSQENFSAIDQQSISARYIGISYFYRFGKLKEKYFNHGAHTSDDDLKSHQ